MPASFYRRYGKRCLDALLAFVGLILFAPVFAIIGVAVWLDSAGSIFFRQVRTGRGGSPFRIFKFRSMRVVNSAHPSLITAAGDPRITRVGRFLRKTKLDELPQLINVLLGDMSLVGPRPEVSRYTSTYTPAQLPVLAVRPGITGPTALVCVNEEEILAQQKDAEGYYKQVLLPAKLQLDLVYCQNIRLRSDLRFILQTVSKIFFRKPSRSAAFHALQDRPEDLRL